MAKQSSPLLLRLLKKVAKPIITLKHKVAGAQNSKDKAIAPMPNTEQELEPNKTQWALAETSDKHDKNRNVVVVQLEAFPHSASGLSTEQLISQNYTIEGDDPNLRITHYPSNRLH